MGEYQNEIDRVVVGEKAAGHRVWLLQNMENIGKPEELVCCRKTKLLADGTGTELESGAT